MQKLLLAAEQSHGTASLAMNNVDVTAHNFQRGGGGSIMPPYKVLATSKACRF